MLKQVILYFLIFSETVEAYLNIHNLTLVKNDLSAVYDIKGNLYEIPNYCINPPYKFIESSFE